MINLDINLLSSNHVEFDALYENDNFNVFFTIALIQMSLNFYNKCLFGYKKDAYWKRIVKQLNDNVIFGEDVVFLPFIWGRDLSIIETDSYFSSRPEGSRLEGSFEGSQKVVSSTLELSRPEGSRSEGSSEGPQEVISSISKVPRFEGSRPKRSFEGPQEIVFSTSKVPRPEGSRSEGNSEGL